jgi:DeoR family glycerol-3-phosphate regulon repressor
VEFMWKKQRRCGSIAKISTENHMNPRQTALIRLLEAEGSQAPANLAQALGVSDETIRRDVAAMAAAGQVSRTHGMVGLAGQLGEAPFARRMRENAPAKQAIARACAALIGDGEAVMLDTGTTTSYVARALAGHRRLTVITNSSDIARLLATQNGNRVYMAGGELRRDNGAAFGPQTLDFIRRFRVQHAVISAGALDASGVMDFDLDEAEYARAALNCAERRIVVSDAAKCARSGLIRVAGWAEITDLITDGPLPLRVSDGLLAAGTQVHVAV